METTPKQNQLIGQGIRSPISFSSVSNQLFELNGGMERINQSIHMILNTPLGERYNLPNFGSNLYRHIFSPIDGTLFSLLYYDIVTALERWEKRIQILSINFITIDIDPGMNPNQVNIQIIYKVIETQQQGMYVFPFSLTAEPSSTLYT